VLSGAFNLWFVFLPSHLAVLEVHHLSTALACGLAGLVVAAVVAPIAGRLPDRVGRRPVLLWALIPLCALPLPMYGLAVNGSTFALLLADAVIGGALAGLVLPAYLSECFPASVRATGLGVTFGLATALIGGTAPLVAAAFSSRGVPHAAPFYLTALAIGGLIAMARAPRTRAAATPKSFVVDG
jgi:MFS transporter, MHS family, proline/betaine transporter